VSRSASQKSLVLFRFLSSCSIIHVLTDNESEKERGNYDTCLCVKERGQGGEIALLLLHRIHVNTSIHV
jgi:hypothetical protein